SELDINNNSGAVLLEAINTYLDFLEHIERKHKVFICSNESLTENNELSVRSFWLSHFEGWNYTIKRLRSKQYFESILHDKFAPSIFEKLLRWANNDVLPSMIKSQPNFITFPTERINELFQSRDAYCSSENMQQDNYEP